MISSVALEALPRAGLLVGFAWLPGPGSPGLSPPGLRGAPGGGAIPRPPPNPTRKRDKTNNPATATPEAGESDPL